LDGSAPRLQNVDLTGVPFPGLPKLLLSATHLVKLWLFDIPHSGYISPEAMVAPFSALSSLRILYLQFRSLQSRPDRESRSLPPPKRSVLPALDDFYFHGATEYLEDLVTFIDAPRLNHMHISFFDQIDFDCPRLAQFINRTPNLMTFDGADVQFDDDTASVKLRYRTSESIDLLIDISCTEPEWQLSSIAQVCNSSLPLLSMVEDLRIEHQDSQVIWTSDVIEDALWLDLLLPFTAVKNIYVSGDFAPDFESALQEFVRDGMIGVFPNLRNGFV
jgi:hypothetical protein